MKNKKILIISLIIIIFISIIFTIIKPFYYSDVFEDAEENRIMRDLENNNDFDKKIIY